MAVGLETMTSFEKIKVVLSDYLEYQQIADLSETTPLAKVGIEDIDLIEILHDLGINVHPFIADYETRRLRSRDIFWQLGKFEEGRENVPQSEHLYNLAVYKFAQDLIAEDKGCMNVLDLVSIADYAATCPDC